jgi:hypothetical protein
VRFQVCAALWCGLLFVQAAPAADRRGSQIENKATTADTSGASAHAILVELFTSEGCSTCPPADALLVKLDATPPVPDAQLIVLSEHVDYWDHDGWKDPNSSPALTERQAAYVSALGLKTPYTPQIIVDGTDEMRLGDPQQEIKVFQKAVGYPKIPVRIGEVTVDGGNPSVLQAHIEADGNFDKHNADIYVAVALDHVESQVLHGENGGRHLTHVAVVQQLTKVGKLKRGQNFNETVQMKLKPGTDPRNIRLVAFVQESGPGRLLGAAVRRPARSGIVLKSDAEHFVPDGKLQVFRSRSGIDEWEALTQGLPQKRGWIGFLGKWIFIIGF